MKSIRVPTLLRMKPKALHRIGKYLKNENLDQVALYWGEGVEQLFSQTVDISFAAADIITLSRETVSSQDVADCFQSAMTLPHQIKGIVAIGGGLVIDYCKYIAHVLQLPCVVVPTVVSNDGFCSPVSSLYVNGARRSVKTVIPHGVVVDTEVIINAPEKYLFAGMGDLFCKITALYDWKLAFKRQGTQYNDFAAILAKNSLDTFVYYDNKDIKNLDFVRVVASSLLMCGVIMEIAGSSRPASGSEHLISHAYDRVAKSSSLHGIQVGVASYAVSLLQEETKPVVQKAIQESGFYNFVRANPLKRDAFLEAIKLAPSMKQDFFTCLSTEGAISKLLNLVETDPLLLNMLI